MTTTSGTVALTGRQYDIEAGEYQATVTEAGAGLRRLSYAGQDVTTTFDQDEIPPHGAGQLLVPWPNRIDKGRYQFGGITCQLELSEAARGNAIHGLTRWANWEPAGQDDSGAAITLEHTLHGRPGYPFCLALTVTYRLDAATGLTVSVTARNAGSRPAPYGTGTHPYLTTGAQVIDGCELHLPAARWLPVDDRGIPAGPPRDVSGSAFDFREPRLLGDTEIDHAFTGLTRDQSGRAWTWLSGNGLRLGIWGGAGCDWVQVFTSDPLEPELRRKALAVEPMTCPPNAFISGDDLITIVPGDAVTHQWGIEVRR